jgi:hypothetical protein
MKIRDQNDFTACATFLSLCAKLEKLDDADEEIVSTMVFRGLDIDK